MPAFDPQDRSRPSASTANDYCRRFEAVSHQFSPPLLLSLLPGRDAPLARPWSSYFYISLIQHGQDAHATLH
ncbi:MAG: hypothetical protein SGI92_32510, partial [Bryobacteraceae bacterium]|nr:hypothetical protein [Bryobacteraceae bacterium]